MRDAGRDRLVDWVRDWASAITRRVVAGAGGRRELSVIVVLAAVLGLDGADTGTVSATASNLITVFGINQTEVGLLASASMLVGAAATVPIGVLTDRVNRTRLLAVSIAFWTVAQLASAVSQSYLWLLIARMALGAVTATAGPTVASLVGDSFAARSRSRSYGYVLAGELVGTGLGFLVTGELTFWFGWRVGFAWLALPGAVLVWAAYRLAEPERGGHKHLQLSSDAAGEREEPDASAAEGLAARAAEERQVQPRDDLVLDSDPTDRSVWWAVKYVLRVRTNVVLIIASTLGYFFFSGFRTDALLFATQHYQTSKSVASTFVLIVGVGALAGVVAGGRTADGLLRRSHIRARIAVPIVALIGTVLAAAPAIATTSLVVALPLLTVAGGFYAATNPPLDAARLDIMHPRLWGRAEAVRTVLRNIGQGVAPTMFGIISEQAFGGGSQGLTYTFLLMLIPLLIAAALGMIALRTYPVDVATASASIDRAGAHPRTDTGK